MQHAPYRRDPCGPDPDLWACVGRAFQPGGQHRLCAAWRISVAGGRVLYRRPIGWCSGRHMGGAPDVRPSAAGRYPHTSRPVPANGSRKAVATFGLLLTILGCLSCVRPAVPYAVGLYITAAYWFTASTSFANPAVTIARALTDTFSGIAPSGVVAFILAQLTGMAVALFVAHWLWRKGRDGANC